MNIDGSFYISYPYLGAYEDSSFNEAVRGAEGKLVLAIETDAKNYVCNGWEVCDLKVSVTPVQEVLADGSVEVSYKVVASAVANFYRT